MAYIANQIEIPRSTNSRFGVPLILAKLSLLLRYKFEIVLVCFII